MQKVQEAGRSVLMRRDRLMDLCDAALDAPACDEINRIFREFSARGSRFESVPAANGAGRLAWAISVGL